MKARWFLPSLLLLALAAPAWVGEPKQPPAKKDLPVFQVPYKLTDTQHVLVRVKINGKGPYNFIVDTGAPLLYISVPIAKKLDLKEDKKLTNVDLDIEGGAKLTKVKALVETPFQLEGMNAMGLPGVELHGIMGASILSHYKMEIDFTKDKMVWTKLDYKPAAPIPLGVKDKDVDNLNALGPMMKVLALLMGKKTIPPPGMRGFVGIELEEGKGKVLVKSVLDNSPAAGKLRAGDVVLEVQGKAVASVADVLGQTARLAAGDTVRLTVRPAGKTENTEVTITAGEGL